MRIAASIGRNGFAVAVSVFVLAASAARGAGPGGGCEKGGPVTPPHPARADEFEPSIPVARAGVEEIAHPELVPDPPLDPGEPGDGDFERAFEARVGGGLDPNADPAAEPGRALPGP